jgi:hypothetical protein
VNLGSKYSFDLFLIHLQINKYTCIFALQCTLHLISIYSYNLLSLIINKSKQLCEIMKGLGPENYEINILEK